MCQAFAVLILSFAKLRSKLWLVLRLPLFLLFSLLYGSNCSIVLIVLLFLFYFLFFFIILLLADLKPTS